MLIHIKTFDLLKRWIVGGVSVIATINATGRYDPDGRLLLLHQTDLHGGSMRAEQRFIRSIQIECILTIACRMICRSIKGIEAMILILNFRAVGNREANLAKGADDIFGDPG